jgi:predicted metal-binding membrane protein
MAVRAVAHRSLFLPILAALVALAWIVLWLWERSPYAILLDHSQMRALCLSSGPLGVLNLYVLGWVLMIAAMMLPTTFPLLEMFRRLTQQKADQVLLMSLLVAGYLAVWLGFGIAAHTADWLVLTAFDRIDPLGRYAWAIGAGVLALAGLFQFSGLKYRCLEKCRTPLSFVTRYWREQGGRTGAFLLGVRHGAFCVGCCWALMLLMFAVGAGNVGWMLALGAVMAIEKNLPWGRRLSPVLGLGLLSWAGAIGLSHTIG